MLNTNVKVLLALFLSLLYPNNTLTAQKIRSLKKQSISNVRLEYDKSVTRTTNSRIPVGISVITGSQQRLTTKGYSKGTLRWSDFKIKADSAIYKNGAIIIPYYTNPPQKITITITPKHHPQYAIKQEISLNLITQLYIKPIFDKNLAPGNTFKIALDVKFNNEALQSYPIFTNEVKKNLHLASEIFGGKLQNGKITIDDDIDKIINHSVYVDIWDERNVNTIDSFQVLLDYIKKYNYYVSGSSGFSSFSGSNGSNGSDGTSAGENGNNGQHGEIAKDGENGTMGSDLDVYADAYFDSILQTTLVYVEVKNLNYNEINKYLFNPKGGNITIMSNGGNGGNGGTGGNGGNGGSGAKGPETIKEWKDSTGIHRITIVGRAGNGGHGGYGGDGGYGGHGGDGGNIVLNYTPETKPYLNLIVLNSNGGSGGFGGKGGYAGRGGIGGTGHPSGRNGINGENGLDGKNGEYGYSGRIMYNEIKENVYP